MFGKIKLFTIILSLAFVINSKAQNDTIYAFEDDLGEIEYFFGFNLIESMGSMFHLVILKPGKNGKHKIIQLTKDDFIAQARGEAQSLANPEAVDFFKKYEINDPNVIDNLWRLRLKEYPYLTSEQIGPGWSANDSTSFIPTENQMGILQKFGLYKMSDFVFGENAFMLLSLMGKPEWVNAYKESY